MSLQTRFHSGEGQWAYRHFVIKPFQQPPIWRKKCCLAQVTDMYMTHSNTNMWVEAWTSVLPDALPPSVRREKVRGALSLVHGFSPTKDSPSPHTHHKEAFMSALTIEEEIQTERQLQKAGFDVFFTLTTGRERDDPLELRHLGFRFINKIETIQGSVPTYWFAVCRTATDRTAESLYHIHGFLGQLEGIDTLKGLRQCWRTTKRKRDPITGTQRKWTASLGRTDFQKLNGDPYVFEYVVKQSVLSPCTNIPQLKPRAITLQVELECGDIAYVG